MNDTTATNFEEVMADLDGGVFSAKIARALSDVALATVHTGKVGKVSITFDMKQIGESSQIEMAHKIQLIKPTNKGKSTEEDTTRTPLHVNRGGKLTLFPEEQGAFEFMKKRDQQ